MGLTSFRGKSEVRVPGLISVMLILFAAAIGSPAAASGFSYAGLDTILSRHLREGRVDYGALLRDPGPLDRFLVAARDARPDAWSRDERFVFWINVYNARVLDGVIRRPGLENVLDVGRIVGIPTLGFFREKAKSGGRKLSLNDIEHDILRKGFDDARVHFVLNCASASCPVLPERALTAATLDSTLEAATLAFLLDSTKNRIAPKAELGLSSIFKWYRSDFVTAEGSLQGFIRRYWPGSGLIAEDAKIRYLDYDWSLNGRW